MSDDSREPTSTQSSKARAQRKIDDDQYLLGDHLTHAAYGTSPNPEPFVSVGRSNALFNERVDRLLRGQSIVLLGDLVASIFVFSVTFFVNPNYNPPLYLWLIALLSITSLRYYIRSQYSASSAETINYESRYQFLIFGSFASGFCWGLTPLIVAADVTPTTSALSALWLAGMLAGAAATLSIMGMVFGAFVLAASLAFVTSVYFHVEHNPIELITSYLLFLIFIIPIGLQQSASASAFINAVLDNRLMRDELTAKKLIFAEKEEELAVQRSKEAALKAQNARADAKLRSAAEDRHLLLNALQEGIFGISDVGAVTFINKSALAMLEYSEAEVIGVAAIHLVNPLLRTGPVSEDQNTALRQTYVDGKAVELIESSFRTKSNKFLPVRYSAEPIVSHGKVIGAVVSFIDISKQKEMESMLLQSQKMEAIGRLTGGVAHDFNNLLTVILGNLQFLERHSSADKKSVTLVRKIMTAAQNGADLNNRLLSFSREQSLQTRNIDINLLMTEMKEFYSRMLGENILLICEPCPESCIAATDKTQLENAILNLCVNAKDAMPNGGVLTISASLTPEPILRLADGRRPVIKGGKPYIELSISDNGSGMPTEVMEKIFEPFFTTKSKGRGTGLGLSTAYGFLNQSGGNIVVESTQGIGTKFRLFLPPGREDHALSPIREEKVLSNVQHTGTILVVEDNESVRDVAVQMLRRSGYKVVEAADGSLGLLKFEAHPEIDLVFSDIIMPGGLNGIEMAEQMLLIRPDLPILLATGFTERRLREKIENRSDIHCVAKPYDTNQLPQLIAGMLDAAIEKRGRNADS
jgi:PAS domain S-box-containing protein